MPAVSTVLTAALCVAFVTTSGGLLLREVDLDVLSRPTGEIARCTMVELNVTERQGVNGLERKVRGVNRVECDIAFFTGRLSERARNNLPDISEVELGTSLDCDIETTRLFALRQLGACRLHG